VDVSLWTWAVTLAVLGALILVDLFLTDRGEPRDFTLRQAGAWVTFYVALAIAFGVGLLLVVNATYAGQFFAGYLTEYSLSIDNLFIFYVIMARFAVPKPSQHKVLLIGILIALILRGAFIALGAAAITRFVWVFFIFGAFLIWTAVGLARGGHDEAEEFKENRLLRWSRRVLRTTDRYEDSKISVRRDGRRVFTPLLIVMIAIGSTDLLFALDSIPAIFGLTKEAYLVFAANAFALMGLRQLYFLLGGLVERLVYLSKGLAVILGFIGVKLIDEALDHYQVPFTPVMPIWASLVVIGGIMAVTTVASLIKARRDPSSVRPIRAVPQPQRASSPGVPRGE
jgi:tellurite resistance protein TerC